MYSIYVTNWMHVPSIHTTNQLKCKHNIDWLELIIHKFQSNICICCSNYGYILVLHYLQHIKGVHMTNMLIIDLWHVWELRIFHMAYQKMYYTMKHGLALKPLPSNPFKNGWPLMTACWTDSAKDDPRH